MRVAAGLARGNIHNLFRMLYRQSTKHDRVEQTEHRRVDANTQCQRDHGHERKAGILPKHLQAISQVLPKGVHCRCLRLSELRLLYWTSTIINAASSSN